MRVDFSESECSNCLHHRTSGIRNTQETEPRFLFGPVRHDSASVCSTSTSSLATTPAAIASVSSGPANLNSGGFGTSTPTGFGGRQGPFGPIFATPTLSVYGTAQGPASSFSNSSSPFGSTQAPAFGSGLFSAPTPSRAVSTEPTQSLGPNSFGFGVTAAPTPTLFGLVQAPVQTTAITTNRSSESFPRPSSSPAPAVTLVSTKPTQSLGQSMFSFGSSPAPTPSLFGSMQAPVQASSASATSSPLSFRLPQYFGNTASVSPFGNGVAYARPDVAILPPASEQSTSTILFGTTPVSVPSLFGPTQETASSTPKNPFSNSFPGFGDSYMPGASSNGFGCNPSPFWGGGSLFAAPKTSSPQPFGFNAATTTLSPSSLSATVTDIPSGGWYFPSRECSRPSEQGSRHTRYAPTPDIGTPGFGRNGHFISISASDACQHKSHEELRWEDYKQGDKGGSYPAAHISPIGSRPNFVFPPSTVSPRLFASESDVHKSHEELRWENYKNGDKGGLFSAPHISPVCSRPNAFFTPSTVSPSIFASPSIFDHPQRTTQGNMPGSGTLFRSSSSTSSTTIPSAPVNPSVQRPHETTDVSSPASGCTACGATSRPSASAYSNGGATTPPSAATSLPGMFFSSFGSFPTMFGTPTLAAQGTAPALQAYPMMFGTTPVAQGANLPVQATTSAVQAYPVQGFLLLPFAAMNLQ